MRPSYLLPFFFLGVLSCGPVKSLSDNKLETFSNITVPSTLKVNQDGVLERTSLDKLSFGGSSYGISKYSSKAALTFVARAPRNTPVPVRFNGDVMGTEVLLKIVEPR